MDDMEWDIEAQKEDNKEMRLWQTARIGVLNYVGAEESQRLQSEWQMEHHTYLTHFKLHPMPYHDLPPICVYHMPVAGSNQNWQETKIT